MSKSSREIYLVHPIVDLLCVGGFSIALLAFFSVADSRSYAVTMSYVAGLLVWGVNWPHFSATVHRLYGVAENRKQYPLTTYVVPAVIIIGLVGSFLEPIFVAPLFVKFHLVWSSYHFSGQTLGVTLIYSRRSGIVMKAWEKRLFSFFIFATFLTSLVGGERTSGQSYYGIYLPNFQTFDWAPLAGRVALIVAGLALVAIYLGWARRSGRWPPFILLLPALAQFCWFILGSGLKAYTPFVPLFHSLQYLLIAWFIYVRESAHSQGAEVTKSFVRRASWRWGAVNVAGGALLFYILPALFSQIWDRPLQFATGVTLAAVQIHHFFVDGVIWKLRNSRNSSPLAESLLDEPVAVVSQPAEVA